MSWESSFFGDQELVNAIRTVESSRPCNGCVVSDSAGFLHLEVGGEPTANHALLSNVHLASREKVQKIHDKYLLSECSVKIKLDISQFLMRIFLAPKHCR